MEKLINLLCGIRMTLISGLFLASNLFLWIADIDTDFSPAWLTIIISGIPIAYLAIKRIIHGKGIEKISSALLITIAIIASVCIGEFFAAGEVAFIMAVGEILEIKTSERAKRGLGKLISLTPSNARIICNGTESIIPADKIKAGDILRVFPGEVIPTDGTVISGETSVDQSVMTGESLPSDKTVGDCLFCGTLNRFGTVDMQATATSKNNSLSNLIQLVKDAQDKKAPVQRTADKWASFLVPASLLVAVITYLITKNPINAVTILVVFCPCALVLATPTAIMAAIGQASKYGVIIKSGEALENMGKTDIVAFDKTGTLTLGSPSVSDIIPCENVDAVKLLSITATAEARSEHPLGKAIMNHAKERNIEFSPPLSFLMKAGKGVIVTSENGIIHCGNEKFITENDIELPDKIHTAVRQFSLQGKAAVITSLNGECLGVTVLSDVLKPESRLIGQQLSALGVSLVLLTGDNKGAAEFMALNTGITHIFPELLPQDKVKVIEELKSEGKFVCMTGDGVNDAPALKAADVGIAMGAMGSDIAVDAADIAIMNDDISKIPYIKRLSLETMKTIKYGIFFSLSVNFIAIILSLMGIIGPTAGALIHNAGSVFVVLISAMLYDKNIT
ncbi:MAG: cation-translocating P-type ATPase [Clostridia bacterium]|nr:cation-translocating P-type ATPase [Clostridia bacterium]